MVEKKSANIKNEQQRANTGINDFHMDRVKTGITKCNLSICAVWPLLLYVTESVNTM